MIKRIHRQNRFDVAIIGICLAAIIAFVLYFLHLRGAFEQKVVCEHDGPHILMLLPNLTEEEQSDYQSMAQDVADRFGLRVEIMSLSTVSSQKRMLSLVPMTDVDAVLFWAVSNIDSDYVQELNACKNAGIPVVLIDHDFENKSLRNSFVGSGINSELMVINQLTLWSVDDDASLVIGSYSHTSSGELYELLFLSQRENSAFDSRQIRSERLKAFVENHPNGYYADRYVQVRADTSGTGALNVQLVSTLLQEEAPGLFFSLSEPLTNALAMAIDSGPLAENAPSIFVGYGREPTLAQYIDTGIIDELVVSDVLYSSKIGLRYLNDLVRGFYIPLTLDSGVELIT